MAGQILDRRQAGLAVADDRSPSTAVRRSKRHCNCCELVQGCLQVLDDLGGDQLRSWQVAGVLQRLVAEPEDVQGCLVP